jgi:hypothetical protein
MHPITPSGSLITSELPSSSSSRASRMNFAFMPIIMIGNSACTLVAKPSAVPTSCAIASAICGTRVFIAADNFSSHCARSSTGTRLHVSKPRRAALTARSTSSPVARGTRPNSCSVADEITEIVSVPLEACHAPS